MFQEYLYIAPVHVQLEAANSFSRVIQDEFVPPYMFASSFLPIVLHNIENRDTGNVVSNSGLKITARCWPVKMTGQTKF